MFGRGGNFSVRGGLSVSYVDIFFNVSDILFRYCIVRAGFEFSVMVRLFRGVSVTYNGCFLLREVELYSGDLLGLGEYFLFMYKDFRIGGFGSARSFWLFARFGVASSGFGWVFFCRLCGRGL